MSRLPVALLASLLLITPLAVDRARAGAPAAEAQAGEDYVRVYAHRAHAAPDSEPVLVSFTRFRLENVKLDLAHLEKSTAGLEIDLTSLSSGIAKRDGHLKSASYLDVAKYPKARIAVDRLVKLSDSRYRARATVTAHGVTREWPIQLEVVSRTKRSVRVEASYSFLRSSFGIGKSPSEGDPSEDELRAEVLLTLSRR